MNDTPTNGSNEHRIRQLEREVRRLRELIHTTTLTPSRDPTSRLVQLPSGGIPARSGKTPGKISCDNVWLDKDEELYLTGKSTLVYNALVVPIERQGDRLLWIDRHDDGYWWASGYDCDDNTGEGVDITTIEEQNAGGA